MVEEKLCRKCSEIKPSSEFFKQKKHRDGLQSYCKECARSYYRNKTLNDEDFRQRRNLKSRKYRVENKDYFARKSAERKAFKLLATPSWLTEDHLTQISDMYKKCPEGYEVDHIVPLRGKNVSGLHVPWNLQHLTKEENRRKSNAYSDFT